MGVGVGVGSGLGAGVNDGTGAGGGVGADPQLMIPETRASSVTTIKNSPFIASSLCIQGYYQASLYTP